MGEPRGVLITRQAAEAAGTAARVKALGLQPVVAPLLDVGRRTVRWPREYHGIVVTSGNAVASLEGGHGPVFAVGDATAARLREAGFREVLSAGGDAADLVALVHRACPAGARLLLVTGQSAGQGVAAGLREAGFLVARRVGYAARGVRRFPAAAAAALAGGELRAALFLSAETALVFGRLLPPRLRPALGRVEALAIGRPAADTLALLPWRRVRVSLGPTLDQVLALL